MKKDLLIRHELMGQKVKVVDSRNKTLIGVLGRVVDETKNTLTIETSKGEKKVIKEDVTLLIGQKEVKGKDLIGRPEKRIKQKKGSIKRW